MRGEVLERALEIALDVADGVDRGARARRPSRGTSARRGERDARSASHSPPRRVDGGGATGRSRSASCANTRAPRGRLPALDGSPAASISSRNADGETIASSSSVKVESETRLARQPQQIVESRARGGEAIGLVRPTELGSRTTDRRCCAGALGPVGLDQPDEPELVDIGVGRGAARRAGATPRDPGRGRERLTIDPAPHGAATARSDSGASS